MQDVNVSKNFLDLIVFGLQWIEWQISPGFNETKFTFSPIYYYYYYEASFYFEVQ